MADGYLLKKLMQNYTINQKLISSQKNFIN